VPIAVKAGSIRQAPIWCGRREEALTRENLIFAGFLAAAARSVQQGCAAGQGSSTDQFCRQTDASLVREEQASVPRGVVGPIWVSGRLIRRLWLFFAFQDTGCMLVDARFSNLSGR
jgi:hypothetical protein